MSRKFSCTVFKLAYCQSLMPLLDPDVQNSSTLNHSIQVGRLICQVPVDAQAVRAQKLQCLAVWAGVRDRWLLQLAAGLFRKMSWLFRRLWDCDKIVQLVQD